ncbi:MAG: NAD(P)/FAD-dependent oxidoreductase [Candidatus Heimdallarchaeota archaeon]|nr:MAG: NAD(P)/FAD-dependent oxidoreductase [Candidatus Heimdallarchaeota archaeon]
MHVVILGSGHAGITSAITLRQNSEDIKITMITEDHYPHYPRPSVYKIISGKKPEQILRYPQTWYDEKNISLLLDSLVIHIDSANKELKTENGKTIAYDKLLIATGSKPFIPPIPGIQDGPLYCLRNIEDAISIRKRALDCPSGEATIFGGGLLSVELAKTLSDIGITSTIIDRSPYLLRKQLDREGGYFFNEVLRKTFKINFLFNATCQNFKHDNENITISINDTTGIWNHKCDFLLNATGIQNDNELPQKAGINIGKYAIVVNPFMQTNIPDIYAAGDAVDIGSFPGSKFGIIPTAIDQAKIAAVNILGAKVPYTGTLPWTTLKVAGINLTSLGDVSTGTGIHEECVLNDPEKGIYRKLFFKDNILQGAILIGTKKNLHSLKTLAIHHASLGEVKEKIL